MTEELKSEKNWNYKFWLYGTSVLAALAGSTLLTQSTVNADIDQTATVQSERASAGITGKWGDIDWVFEPATQTLRFTSSGTIPRHENTNGGRFAEDRSWMIETNGGADIRKIVFEQPVTAPQRSTFLFQNIAGVQEITGLENIDTSDVWRMDGMFSWCKALSNIQGMSSWDVSHVVSMDIMFSSCTSLADTQELSGWDITGVSTMRWMFEHCTSLSSLQGLSSWDVSNVQYTDALFFDCRSLTNLSGLSNWRFSNTLTNLGDMFYSCQSLSDITALSSWDVSHVTDMVGMFGYCKVLSDLSSISGWDVSDVASIRLMFGDCQSLYLTM